VANNLKRRVGGSWRQARACALPPSEPRRRGRGGFWGRGECAHASESKEDATGERVVETDEGRGNTHRASDQTDGAYAAAHNHTTAVC
jgi:hypothetical protein